jgi:hypothetical protein
MHSFSLVNYFSLVNQFESALRHNHSAWCDSHRSCEFALAKACVLCVMCSEAPSENEERMLSSLKPSIELRQSQVDSAIDPSGPPTPTFPLGPLLHTPAEKKIFRDFRKCNPSGRCERERRALSHPDFFFSLAGGIAIFFFPLAFPFPKLFLYFYLY